MKSIYDDTRCDDCRRETNHLRLKRQTAEWYGVHDAIWEQVIKCNHANFLCIGCLEKRLGRELTAKDFSDIPLNRASDESYSRSKRLRERMTRQS